VNILKKIEVQFLAMIRGEHFELNENRPLAKNYFRINRFPCVWNRIGGIHKKIRISGCGQGGENADQADKKNEKWNSFHELNLFKKMIKYGHTKEQWALKTWVNGLQISPLHRISKSRGHMLRSLTPGDLWVATWATKSVSLKFELNTGFTV